VPAFPKVLVVDNGARPLDHSLAADLAELGYASVTASLEAADDVLAVLRSPAAILLQLPRDTAAAERDAFLALAERLKARHGAAGVPVVVIEQPFGSGPASFASALEGRIGATVLNEPER
jgi:hypothetical protein